MYIDDFFPFVIPIMMYLFGGDHSVLDTMKMFFIITASGGFLFMIIGINAGHFHPDIVHDGDAMR